MKNLQKFVLRSFAIASLLATLLPGAALHAQPTKGWAQSSFTYSIQTPWNLPQGDRYKLVSGVHYFWIYNGDECQFEGCSTGPRSEMRWKIDYTSGRHQFEGDVYIVSGTAGTEVMQVFGGSSSATGFMLKVTPANGGTLKHYDSEVLMTNVYGKWIHVNVQHDADNNKVYIYLDSVLKGTFSDHGNGTHYFKCGVYNISGTKSESRWKNLKYWKNGPVGKSIPAENTTIGQTVTGTSLVIAPNPVTNGVANLHYTLDVPINISLAVYDANGKVVTTLVNGFMEEGAYNLTWDCGNKPAGIYVIKLVAGEKVCTSKVVVR